MALVTKNEIMFNSVRNLVITLERFEIMGHVSKDDMFAFVIRYPLLLKLRENKELLDELRAKFEIESGY